ncbi:MAG: hypothetical protein HYZ81_14800 [Nitrospinae bacterium]|nr:hypothetical protein [Nitrospinota bacterium]
MRESRVALFLIMWGLIVCPTLALAGGEFSIGGRPVEPQDTNFAGVRHASPKYRISVQINHDTQMRDHLELTVVDEVFQALLADHRREPLLSSNFLTVVFITEAKMSRFYEGPKRRIFRMLEGEMEKHPDVYLSPTAVFISDSTLSDDRRLRSALYQGLGYLFRQEFYEAMEGLINRGIPVPYPHD